MKSRIYKTWSKRGITIKVLILTLLCLVGYVFYVGFSADVKEVDMANDDNTTEITLYDAARQMEFVRRVINKTNDEWKDVLEGDVYYVTRKKGTEKPFTGEFLNNKSAGIYSCSNCGNHLFLSETKYDSGTGWPSFYKPVSEYNIDYVEDKSLFTVRTEIVCALCGAHLGHVFDDGPAPTGKRYCINSLALNFQDLELNN